MRTKLSKAVGRRHGLVWLGMMTVLGSPLASADQQIHAVQAIDRVAGRHGSKFVQKIVQMTGAYGQSQPEEWRMVVYDATSESMLREFWIGDTRATNEGANYDFYPKHPPSGFINLQRLKFGSMKAFTILDREASGARIGFDTIDYLLRCREFSDEPIWTLTAKNADGYEVARIYLSGESGQVLRTIWTYRQGRRVSKIVDSSLRGGVGPAAVTPPVAISPEELERRRMAELTRQREAIRQGDPSRPVKIAEPQPIDPAPADPAPRTPVPAPVPVPPAGTGNDPGTEVPEVIPIEPEPPAPPREP